MHELSLSSAILDTVLKHAEGRRVTAVTLRIGHLRQVVPDSLAFYFEFVAKGTVCEGAVLEPIEVPARLHCSGCGVEWNLESRSFRCVGCGGGDVVVVSGQEFEVESIDVEEDPCMSRR